MVMTRVVVRPFSAIARFLARVVRSAGSSTALVNGAARLVGLGGRGAAAIGQSGYVRSYALVFLVGVIVVLGYFGYVVRVRCE